MLTRGELMQFVRRYDGQKSLSAYVAIPGDSATPATAARALLRRGLERIRYSLLDASHAEREAFERSAARLSDCAEAAIHRQGAGTWVAFASANGDCHHETIRADLPTCIVWEERVRIVPYLSVLQGQGALVVLLDRERATISRFAHGALTEIEEFETPLNPDPRQPLSVVDDETAWRRQTAHVIGRISALDHAGEWLVLGGPTESLAHLISWLAPSAAGRLVVVGSLGPPSAAPVVRAAVESAIADRHRQVQQRLVAELVSARARPAASAAGRAAVDVALAQGAVRKLVIAEHWGARNPAEAEEMTRLAFTQDAIVEVVRGDAGSAVEVFSDGVAARLRYAVSLPPIQLSDVVAGAANGMEN